ncbi:AlpA family phage regulatory protein [Lichenicoccus roseus]|uniref:AlpA family phage regulatory protein n=2 Tax=Lichenicoccus roseus TaxID=2683649 RepID=A0A5R9J5J5_9PROT|nr:AlpA family phage regulatory protein [Lichenicoccus roseus]TLU70891.1 AlpA family phage regulatory protein [Lichenicoccus roseus]
MTALLPDAILPGDRLISIHEVKARVGLGQSTIYARMATGAFPKARPLGPRTVRWVEREIDAWVAAIVTGQDHAADRRQA